MYDIDYRQPVHGRARYTQIRRRGWSMTTRKLRRHWSRHPKSTESWTPGEATEFDALVAACALVAHADGWVTQDERRGTLERLRGLEAVKVFGVAEVQEAFEALISRFERDPEDGVELAEAAIERLRGRSGPSDLLIEAACAVAAADGGFDEEERDTILRLCALLGVKPGDFDLEPEGGGTR